MPWDVDYFIKRLDGLMLKIVLELQFLSAPLDYSVLILDRFDIEKWE